MPPTTTKPHFGRVVTGHFLAPAAEAHNEYRLTGRIVELSDAKTWEEAKDEWGLVGYYHLPAPRPTTECVCGHPIRHVFVVRHESGRAARVGCDCVRRFTNPDPDADPFATLMAIAAAPDTARIGAEVAEMLNGAGWLNDWELGFCRDVARYRRLSPGQRAKMTQTNRDVLRRARADADDALDD